MADAAVLTPGSIIREFRIVRLVGEGGMGQVYEAKHTFTGARVAVKRMLPGLSQDPQLRQRFIWEARVMAICTHPGLVDIMQLFVEGGRFFLVMKFLEGDSAEDKVASSVDQGLLPDLREAVDIVSQVCSALQHMHDLDEEIEVPDADGRMVQRRIRGIVHRDVKPGNIMVDSAGQACLMDFGIAKAQGGETMTRVGGVVGTYEYMSPQQIQGEEVGASSDQYSLAVTLYMMLTGAVPFPQQTSGGFDAQEGHVRKPPPPPRSVRGDIPESLSNVILKALAKDPKDRFPSCRDFGAALQRAIGGEAVVPPPPPHRTVQEDWHGGVPGAGTFDDVPPPSGFPVWLLAGLGALVLVLVVVLGVMWLGGKEPAEERKSVAQTPAPIGGFKPAGGEEARRLAEEKRRLEEERRKNQEEARSLAEQRKSVEEERRRGEEEDRQRAKKQREEELEAKRAEDRKKEEELKTRIREQARAAAAREAERKAREAAAHQEEERRQEEQRRRQQILASQIPSGMVKVSAGWFNMGGSGQESAPQVRVYLSEYAIDEYVQSHSSDATWNVADKRCRDRGWVLASEAQWEKAATAGHFSRAAGDGYGREAEWVRDWYAKRAYANVLEGNTDPVVSSTSQADYRPGVTAKYQRQGKTSSDYCRVSRSYTWGNRTDWKRVRAFWMPDYAKNYGWRCVKEL